MFPAPKINTKWVCVAGHNQTLLAAQLSSYFNEPGVYFPVFEFPDMKQPYEEVASTDDYFSQILGRRAASWINNSLSRLQPDRIILLGLSDAAASYLRAVLPAGKLIVINTEADLLAQPFAQGKSEPLKCKPFQPIEALLQAKLQGRPLKFDDVAPDLSSQALNGKPGLILLENSAEISEVSTINYAISIDADIVIAPKVERDEIQTLPRRLQAWAADHSSDAFREMRKMITDRIKGIDFAKYQFATFFTAGLPYGLVLENIISFTHVPNGPYSGVLISDTIAEAITPMEIGNSLLFGIEGFINDETSEVASLLDKNNFLVTILAEKDATNNNLDKFGAHLPYDLLHICSHGGETTGYFVKQEFEDRKGTPHTIEYFEIVSFSEEAAAQEDHVLVSRKMIFTTLDGMAWIDHPLSKYEDYVGRDMMQALKEDKQRLRRTPVQIPIAMSAHIKCHESFHQGAFDRLAGFTNPIVFNNSCSSSYELSGMFLAAGARVYIGTLWNVKNAVAVKAAITFYKKLLADHNVLMAYREMMRSITYPQNEHIYIFWGLHFSYLWQPRQKSDDRIVRGLLAGYFLWLKKFATTQEEEIKRNCVPILRFFQQEIQRRLTREQLQKRIEEIVAEQPEFQDLDPERGATLPDEHELTEITLNMEMPKSA